MKNMEARIREANASLNWISESELAKRGLGRVLRGLDGGAMTKILAALPLPERVAYAPSDPDLENSALAAQLSLTVFGEMPTQVGYCIGHNRNLNALEFHGGSEVLVAGTDLVLLLDSANSIVDGEYSPQTLAALYVCEGQVVELFGRTLHFAPLEVDGAGFRAAIALPRGTNLPLEGGSAGLLFAKNKWLVAHPDSPSAQRGAKVGILGENIGIKIP